MGTESAVHRNKAKAARARRIVLVVMCAGYFLVLLDVTIVNVALPTIESELHASVSGLQWVVDGYMIALAALMLAGGTVGDLRGHKRMVLTGLALFGIASLGCGLAPTTNVLVALRVIQGVGAALMLPGTLAVITHAYPKRSEQARAIGLWAGIGSLALPAGPLLGGALIQAIGWRAVFFVNVPVVCLAIAVAARTVQESSQPQDRRIDLPGVSLGAATLALVTFTFIQAGHSGLGLPVVVAIGTDLVLVVAFLAVERSREQPMLPLALFRRPVFTTANSVAAAMNLASLGLLFVLTLYLQDVLHHSALAAGLALVPLFAPLSVIAPLGGRVTARVGPKWPMILGLLLATGGVALLSRLGAGSSYLALLPGLVLWGSGLGVLTPAVVAAAIGAVPPDRTGLASAVNNTARQASGAIGIAAFGALAGAPTGPGFLAGFHTATLIGAGLFLASAIATFTLVRSTTTTVDRTTVRCRVLATSRDVADASSRPRS